MIVANDEKSTEEPRLFTFVGSAFVHIFRYPSILPKGVYILIDAEDELEGIELVDDVNHVFFKLSIPCKVVQDFVDAWGTDEQKALFQELPNVSTKHGMGQVRVVGGDVVKDCINRVDFAHLIKTQVLPMLRRMADGELNRVSHQHYSGTAGGMGSAGGLVIVRAIQSLFVDATDPEIETEVFLLGGLTFCSPEFERTTENSSAAIVEWVAHVKEKLTRRASTIIRAFELLPVGTDTKLRNRMLFELFIAVSAEEYRRDERRSRPNKQISGTVGGTQLLRTDHLFEIPKSTIAAISAAVYIPLLRQILSENPNIDSVDQVGFATEHHSIKRESISSIMMVAIVEDADDVIESAATPSRTYRYYAKIRLRSKHVYDLRDPKTTFSARLKDETEAAKRLRALRTCCEACFREWEPIGQELEEANEDVEWLRHDSFQAVRQLQGGWLGWIRSGFRSLDTRLTRVEDVLTNLRAATDRHHKLAAKSRALQTAIEKLEQEDQLLTDKITLICKQLKKCLPRNDEERSEKLVNPAPLAKVFSPLLRYAESNAPTLDHLREIVGRAVDSVTVKGLARMARCEPSIEAVVGSVLARKNVDRRSPSWGGEKSVHIHEEKFVFPPVTSNVKSKLLDHFEDEKHRVAFTDAIGDSPNIVCLETVYSKTTADVIAPFYDAGVRLLMESDRRDLFIFNRAAFERLGYQIPKKRRQKDEDDA